MFDISLVYHGGTVLRGSLELFEVDVVALVNVDCVEELDPVGFLAGEGANHLCDAIL